MNQCLCIGCAFNLYIKHITYSIDTSTLHKVKHWDPPLVKWLKWNIDASSLEARHTSTISYVCKDNIGRVQYSYGMRISDDPILVVKILLLEKRLNNYSKTDVQLIIQSDSLITIQAINSEIEPLR